MDQEIHQEFFHVLLAQDYLYIMSSESHSSNSCDMEGWHGHWGWVHVIRQKRVFPAEACFLLSAESEVDPENHLHRQFGFDT